MSDPSAPPDFGPEQFAAVCDVSRETLGRLKIYVGVLREWNAQHNLVSAGSLADVWRRHIWDCAQLAKFVPLDARSLADMGAGAGFPGLVIACALADQGGGRVDLVEANSRKAAFLREAARVLAVPAIVHCARIEEFVPRWSESADVVTARALAPLPRLLDYAAPALEKGAQGLFLKGQDVEAELTEAAKSWNIAAELVPSVTDPSGRIVVVRRAERLGKRP